MLLTVLNSGSAGNGYMLSNGSETLIIECGIDILQVKKELDFDISSIIGAIVSHAHGDHSKHVGQFTKAGIPVLADQSVFDTWKVTGHRAKAIQPRKPYYLGGFRVYGFELEHDVPNMGYLIHHEECGTVVFMTDTYFCRYTFQNVRHFLIEANYSTFILERNIAKGKIPSLLRDVVANSHMELDTCIDLLKANDLSQVHNIVLLHLSDSNSNEQQFVNKVTEATGKPVYVAKRGLFLNINIKHF